jgi:hypothetical protein
LKEGKKKKQLTIEKFFVEMGEELKCAICLDLFDKPLLLSCTHTFCQSCLEEVGESFFFLE